MTNNVRDRLIHGQRVRVFDNLGATAHRHRYTVVLVDEPVWDGGEGVAALLVPGRTTAPLERATVILGVGLGRRVPFAAIPRAGREAVAATLAPIVTIVAPLGQPPAQREASNHQFETIGGEKEC